MRETQLGTCHGQVSHKSHQEFCSVPEFDLAICDVWASSRTLETRRYHRDRIHGRMRIMGFFDAFVNMADELRRRAEAALEYTRRLAEELERKVREAIEEAEHLATTVTQKVEKTVEEMKGDLEKLVPSFDDKIQEIVDQITEVATTAADEGVDITEAIKGAVSIALETLKRALQAAIDVISRFFNEASGKLFSFLEGVLPGSFQFILKPVRATVDWGLKGLASFADNLKSKISGVVNKIKVTVEAIVRRIGEVLGPIWGFIKKLWRLLFGSEPEQCALTAAWFDERLKRAEK